MSKAITDHGRPRRSSTVAATEPTGREPQRLTIEAIKKIRGLGPAATAFDVRDTVQKNFLLRVQPTGLMTYYYEASRGERIRIGRTDEITPDEARNEAKKLFAKIITNPTPAVNRKLLRSTTLGQFIERHYIPWAEVNVRSPCWVPSLMRTFKPLMNTKLVNITTAAIEEILTARKAVVKGSTVNRDLSIIKAVLYRAATTLGEFPNVAAARKLKPDKLDSNKITRYLSADEEARLRAALDNREERIRRGRDSANKWRRERDYELLPDLREVTFADYLKPMALTFLNTGMRKGEVFGLEWHDVMFEIRTVVVDGTKAKDDETRTIPMNDELYDVLSAWHAQRRPDCTLVFPNAEGRRFNNVRRSWAGVLKKAGITRFRQHDTRHSFASNLVMTGTSLLAVGTLLGHSDPKLTLRYAHLAPGHLAEAVAKLVKKPPR
jgi:integrase